MFLLSLTIKRSNLNNIGLVFLQQSTFTELDKRFAFSFIHAPQKCFLIKNTSPIETLLFKRFCKILHKVGKVKKIRNPFILCNPSLRDLQNKSKQSTIFTHLA